MPLPTIPSGNVASATAGGYEVANSCRFDAASDAYMHKTPASAGNTGLKKFTFSTWVKRGGVATEQTLIRTKDASNVECKIGFDATGELRLYRVGAILVTNAKYRDPSAWMHVVFAVDTTQASSSNRLKLYVNGTQVTSFGTETQPSADHDMKMCGDTLHIIGGVWTDDRGGDMDGYLAETVLIDGTQYAASDFGEFDSDSPTIWKPKDVSALTFGTNGFYLDFEDSSNLGNDANGGTDLTEVNLAATDQATDTPTNNFCTLNPLAAANNQPTFSQGNCQSVSSGAWYGTLGTMGVSAGKWYWEVKVTTTGGNFHGVIADYVNFDDATVYNEVGATSYTSDGSGEMYYGADTTTADYGSVAQNAITGIALNMDDKQITIYNNGSAIVSNFALDDATNLDFVLPFGFEWSATVQYNFGGCPSFAISSGNADANGYGNMEYPFPDSYYSLCSKNLAEFG